MEENTQMEAVLPVFLILTAIVVCCIGYLLACREPDIGSGKQGFGNQ